jgi:flagellar biogenesis protein FliO
VSPQPAHKAGTRMLITILIILAIICAFVFIVRR